MTTYLEHTVKCGCCGEYANIICLESASSFGGCDLDTRPAQLLRGTMGRWIQVCPHCGYVNSSLEDIVDGAEMVVKSKQYKECEGIHVDNELAKSFIRWGMICAKQNDLEKEMRAYLHAAWACDDAGEEETASLLRQKCEVLLTQMMKTDYRGVLRLLDADLLRRSGQFDEVIRRYSTVGQWTGDFDVTKSLHFEIERAKEKDTRSYKFAGVDTFELNE